VSDQVVEAFREEVVAFEHEVTRAEDTVDDLVDRVEALQVAHARADDPDPDLSRRLYQARLDLLELRESLEGSEARDEIGERAPPTPDDRLDVASDGLDTTYGPTPMHRRMLEVGRAELAPIQGEIDRMANVVSGLETEVEASGAPPVEGGDGGR
jgi:hypothetical protein